jgi:DNA-binding Lrp family transcriptional regulator
VIAQEIAAHPEVKTVYLMSGAYDLAVIVEGKSLKSVSRFVSECISTYDTVLSTATHFILKKYKVEGALMTKTEQVVRLSVQP